MKLVGVERFLIDKYLGLSKDVGWVGISATSYLIL